MARRHKRMPLVIAIGLVCTSSGAYCASPSVLSTELDRLSQAAARSRAACGPRALWYALGRLGRETEADELIAMAQPGPLGTPIKRLVEIAHELGAPAMAIKSNPNRVTQLPIPSILIVDKGSHCVVYDELDERNATATIFEPDSNRRQVVTLERLQRAWTGEAIVFNSPYPSRLAFFALTALIAVVIGSPAAYLAFRSRHPRNGPS